MRAILDSGPLFAAASRRDVNHARCLQLLSRGDLNIVVPTLVVGETAFLIGSRIGADAEARFLASASDLDMEHPQPEDWVRMASLVATYRNFPLGTVDASVIAVAERLGIENVITLDHRHFRSVRPNHVAAFDLLPE